MKMLVIPHSYPMYDKYSGDLRFSRLLSFIAERNEVHFYCLDKKEQSSRCCSLDLERYADNLLATGVIIVEGTLRQVLDRTFYDYVLFEFYGTARQALDEVRYRQPGARIIVDTVDVHFKRIASQAAATNDSRMLRRAERVKRKELDVYCRADIIFVVTAPDQEALSCQNPSMNLEIVPNIHDVPPLDKKACDPATLLFVGGFGHNPNTDAVIYFFHEILPIIQREIPGVKVTFVGDGPPPEIQQFSSGTVTVAGFVRDLKPYLDSHAISIAPLRFGAGMKGKIGEAMAYGLPVVTTTVGIEGFGLIPGEHALVGDTPTAFARCVVRLISDRSFYNQIRENAWRFIRNTYAEDVVKQRVHALLDRNFSCQIKRLSLARRLRQWLR